MICRIKGVLERIDGLGAVVAPVGDGAVAYEVLLPAFLAERLSGRIGGQVSFITFHYLEGQGQGTSFVPRLVGFSTAAEREFFELFTTVKGIGNRKALRAMAVEPSGIAAAIIRKDAAALIRLPEIGKRLAETVIAELSGKVEAFLSPAESAVLESGATASAGAGHEDAVLALMALGEPRPEAERLVVRALERARRGNVELTTPEAVVEYVFAARAS